MDLGTPIANGASIAVLGIVVAAFFKLQFAQWRANREAARVRDIQDYRLEAQELETRWCQRNFSILAQSVVMSGGQVDPALYDPAPMPRGATRDSQPWRK